MCLLVCIWLRISIQNVERTQRVKDTNCQLNMAMKLNCEFSKEEIKMAKIFRREKWGNYYNFKHTKKNNFKSVQHLYESWKCKLKSFWDFSLTSIRMVKVRKQLEEKFWEQSWEGETFIHSWWLWKLVQKLWKSVWRHIEHWEIDLPYNATVPSLGMCTKDVVSYPTDTWQPNSLLLYSQESGGRNNLHTNQLMNG